MPVASINDRKRKKVIDMAPNIITAISLTIFTLVILISRWFVEDTRRCRDIGLQLTHKIQETLELFDTRDFLPTRKIMISFHEVIGLYSKLPRYRRIKYKPIVQETWSKVQTLARDYFVAEEMIIYSRKLSELGIR